MPCREGCDGAHECRGREEPHLLHALPSRIRVHLPQWWEISCGVWMPRMVMQTCLPGATTATSSLPVSRLISSTISSTRCSYADGAYRRARCARTWTSPAHDSARCRRSPRHTRAVGLSGSDARGRGRTPPGARPHLAALLVEVDQHVELGQDLPGVLWSTQFCATRLLSNVLKHF
jgi:hypothetical protein